MRLQISLPQEMWEKVRQLAELERRPPRNQIEHFIVEAVKRRPAEAAKPSDTPLAEVVHA